MHCLLINPMQKCCFLIRLLVPKDDGENIFSPAQKDLTRVMLRTAPCRSQAMYITQIKVRGQQQMQALCPVASLHGCSPAASLQQSCTHQSITTKPCAHDSSTRGQKPA